MFQTSPTLFPGSGIKAAQVPSAAPSFASFVSHLCICVCKCTRCISDELSHLCGTIPLQVASENNSFWEAKVCLFHQLTMKSAPVSSMAPRASVTRNLEYEEKSFN